MLQSDWLSYGTLSANWQNIKNQYVIKFLRRLEERNSHVGDIKILKWSLMCMFTTANFKSQFSQHDFFQTRGLILCRGSHLSSYQPSMSTGWLSVISNFSSDELSSSKSLNLFCRKVHIPLHARHPKHQLHLSGMISELEINIQKSCTD